MYTFKEYKLGKSIIEK